jgi:pilus assembly protein Flp/PilA
MNKILRFIRNEEGATAVEYAVLIALILGVVITSVGNLGQSTSDAYTNFEGSMP